jgi:hypothetical protein
MGINGWHQGRQDSITAYSYLTPENIFRHYQRAKDYTYVLTLPFPEFERIARNRPFEGIDPAYPKTTDGTAASIVQKTPKRVVQQLPTGSIESDQAHQWLDIVAEFIYTEKILPYANEDYGLFEKSHLAIEGGLTFGSQCTYTPFLNHDGYFCPDLTLPYWGDIFLQRGKKSGYACSYVFMRSWWQKDDVKALIESEKKLAKSKSYKPTWDVKALAEVLEAQSTKDFQAMTPDEKERGLDTTAIEFVTGFQKGVGAKFLTFVPMVKKVVRTKVNKDPRGKMPIDWLYGDIDGNNPMGRGIIELIGGLQNLIDSDMQMYQYNRALMLAPPVIKYGNIGDFSYTPNAVIDAQNDPNAKIVPLDIDTTAIANYPALYGLQKSQMLNLVNSPDTSISSQVGNPSFSKTPQGVKAQQATISVDDNAVRKRFESWFRNWSETAINLYFAERTGKEKLQLNKETAMRLRELPDFDQKLLTPDDKILIDYDTDTPILKFRIDPNTTSVADKATQVQDAQGVLDMVMKYPILNKTFGGPIDIDVLARRIVVNSGIDDPEQVAPEPTAAQLESKKLQANQVNPFSPFFDKPSVSIAWEQIPPKAQLDLLRNAGSTSVTIEDILAGPVANINARGNTALNKPLDDPSQLMPGGGGADQSSTAKAPINLSDIYKQTTDPQVKSEIEAMAGLHPNPMNVANQVVTNQTEHTANQASNLGQATDALMPPQAPQAPQSPQPPQQPQQPQGPNPLDAKLVEQLQRLGLSPGAIAQAIDMLNKGASQAQILQAIGVK